MNIIQFCYMFNKYLSTTFNMRFLIIVVILMLSNSTILQDIQTLRTQLYSTYWNQNQTFVPFLKWDRREGLFESYIHFNVVGSKNNKKSAYLRNKFKIADENMFVTSFVLYGLLQAQQLGTIKIDHHLFSMSLQTLASFRDKNQEFGVAQYMFWPQEKINGTWSSKSVNLFNLIDLLPNIPKRFQNYLSNHGFGLWIFAKQIKKQFCIPADVDDSSVNIVLLGLLDEIKSDHYSYWQSVNFNTQKFYDTILRYAYRPFDKTNKHPRSNEIDPRTYFIIHNFLKQKKEEAEALNQQPSVILPTTWILDKDQQVQDIIKMPFSLNNVDASVNSNFLFGLIYLIKNKRIQLKGQLGQMIMDIADLLVYVIEDAIERRPDLILMYYPSKYDFYWFVARTLSLLQTIDTKSPQLLYVYLKLSKAMRNKGTQHILKQKIEAKDKSYFWVQFLGNYAGKNRAQDSVYSTALVLNALLDTWGFRQNHKYRYLAQTPSQVKNAVQKGAQFLRKSIKSKNMNNAFFSGSLKIVLKDYPAIFPANKILDKKGKAINAQTSTPNDANEISDDCMKGYIEDSQYRRMIGLKWFGYDVPTTFDGYNDGKGMLFPFWSSPSITLIMMITSLSKYSHTLSQLNSTLQ